MAKRKVVVTYKNCKTCQALIKGGMCRDNTCVEITTPAGQAIAKKGKVTAAPQCVTVDTASGKVKKCNTLPYLTRYLPRK